MSLLLFDLDGTLTNPALGIGNCIRYAFEQLDRSPPDAAELRHWVGPPLQKSFTAALDDEQLAERAVACYRERFAEVGLFENELIDGIAPLLQQLAELQHRCVVATSKPTVYSTRIITHFGLDDHLAEVYGSELDGTRSDKSELIAYIMQQEQAAAADTRMIGDRKHDIIGARANGLRSIGVLWGFGDEQELLSAGATNIVGSVTALGEQLAG